MELNVLPGSDSPWYAEGLKFTCTQCGNCCTGEPGYVWISKVEIERLAEFLKIPRGEVVNKYGRNLGGRISLKEKRSPRGEYDCIFLQHVPVKRVREGVEVTEHKRICSIYPVRPLQCRTWPFWSEIIKTPQRWEKAGQRCPGINVGHRHFSVEKIHQMRDATDWPTNPPSSEGSSGK